MRQNMIILDCSLKHIPIPTSECILLSPASKKLLLLFVQKANTIIKHTHTHTWTKCIYQLIVGYQDSMHMSITMFLYLRLKKQQKRGDWKTERDGRSGTKDCVSWKGQRRCINSISTMLLINKITMRTMPIVILL